MEDDVFAKQRFAFTLPRTLGEIFRHLNPNWRNYVIVRGRLERCTTFELDIVVIGTHEPSCIQMEIYVEIFVDFDGL